MLPTFEAALESGDIEGIRAWPKGDLHNHGFLSSDRQFLRERIGVDIAPVAAPLVSMDAMHEWVGANVAPHFTGAAGRLLGYEAAFALARRDGVTRIEIGDDIGQSTRNDATALTLIESLSALHRAVAPEVEWIPLIGISRHWPISSVERRITPFLELCQSPPEGLPMYRVLDLYGDEMFQPIENYAPVYRMARAAGLRLKAHAGEWGSADDVWRAVELLELDEVQHGIAAVDSPEVMRFLADHDIRLNLCPTSNVMLGRVTRLEEHPMRRLYDAGVPITINTDDALVFGATVSEEFLALYRIGLFTASELDEIRRNSLSDSMRVMARSGAERAAEAVS